MKTERLEDMTGFVDGAKRDQLKKMLQAIIGWKVRPSSAEEVRLRQMALLYWDRMTEDPEHWTDDTRSFLSRVVRDNEAKFAGVYRGLK